MERALAAGADLFIGGEMGVGNTTSAAAVAAALLEVDGEAIADVGTGLDVEGVSRKRALIQRALDFHGDQLIDPLAVLRCLGGFEITALCGSMVAAAQRGIPLLIDGFITTVAALAAVRIQPDVRQWMLFSHRSVEQGHRLVLEALVALIASGQLMLLLWAPLLARTVLITLFQTTEYLRAGGMGAHLSNNIPQGWALAVQGGVVLAALYFGLHWMVLLSGYGSAESWCCRKL